MPIYMNINDGEVKGNVTEANHTDWIELDSLQLGVSRGISTPVGAAADREGSAPSVSDIVVTKPLDESSNTLFAMACSNGTGGGKKVVFHVTKTGDESGLSNYAEYELTDALISSYSSSTSGDRPIEAVSFNFTKLMQKTITFNADTGEKGPAAKTYDVATATVS